MKIEFKITEQDFLTFQLFTVSRSERVKKRKITSWLLLTLLPWLFAWYYYLNQNIYLTIYLVLVGVIAAIFYPMFFKRRFKNHYKNHIKDNYKKRFGQPATIELNEEGLFTKDNTGEGKIHLSEIESIDEIKTHFILRISSGLSLIIPKSEINNIDALRMKFNELGLTVNDETDWKW